MINQKLNKFSNRIFSLLFIFVFASINAQTSKESQNPQIYHIQNYFSEAYLVKGNNEKLILIETGVPVAGYQDSLVDSIKKLGFKPENITLAIVTHGHGDHAGNARFLQQTFHIAIAGSKADLGKFTSGKTELSKSEDVGVWGTRLRPNMDMNYSPFTPDILVEDTPIDLAQYGVDGKIIPLRGGHTPGDLLVLIGDNLFVGDAFIGTFKAQNGGLVADGYHVREHFYHENRNLADQNLQLIEKIVVANKVTTLYPTHNGPVSSYEFLKYLKEEPLLKLLIKQKTELLNDVVNGKAGQNAILSESFIFQSADRKQYTNMNFLNAYIKNPKDKIQSLFAEDFRIIFSNQNTLVFTYIENLTLENKESLSVFVNETYSKVSGSWKLVFKQLNNQ